MNTKILFPMKLTPEIQKLIDSAKEILDALDRDPHPNAGMNGTAAELEKAVDRVLEIKQDVELCNALVALYVSLDADDEDNLDPVEELGRVLDRFGITRPDQEKDEPRWRVASHLPPANKHELIDNETLDGQGKVVALFYDRAEADSVAHKLNAIEEISQGTCEDCGEWTTSDGRCACPLNPVTGLPPQDVDEDDEENECPVDDPSCEGGAGDCHDACERPAEQTIAMLRADKDTLYTRTQVLTQALKAIAVEARPKGKTSATLKSILELATQALDVRVPRPYQGAGPLTLPSRTSPGRPRPRPSQDPQKGRPKA